MAETCPKCGYAKVEGGECLRCRVIVWKYRAYLQRPDRVTQDRQGRAEKGAMPTWCWIVTLATFLTIFGHWAFIVTRKGQAALDFTLESLDRQWASLRDTEAIDWLIHNPVADMYWPNFLLLYGSAIALILLACWGTLRPSGVGVLSPPAVPAEPDPYEIAYLRGGEHEVTATVVFGLIQRGYLRVSGEANKWYVLLHLSGHFLRRWHKAPKACAGRRVEQTPGHPDPRHLSSLERSAFDWFSAPETATWQWASDELPSGIMEHCTHYEERLRKQGLFSSVHLPDKARKIGLLGGIVISTPGSYKLLVELFKGHDEAALLFVVMMGSLLLLSMLCSVSHLSRRGRAYLDQLTVAFGPLKKEVVADPTRLLLVGLFGVGVLAGGLYSNYEEIFHDDDIGPGMSG